MFKNFVTVAVLFIAQIARADEVDDALAALNDFRLTISNALNEAFTEHVKMANDVAMTSFRAKEADEFADTCVDKAGPIVIRTIEKMANELGQMALKPSWEDEIELIQCGRTDTECLTVLTEKIKKQAEEAGDSIEKQLEADREEIDKALEELALCAV